MEDIRAFGPVVNFLEMLGFFSRWGVSSVPLQRFHTITFCLGPKIVNPSSARYPTDFSFFRKKRISAGRRSHSGSYSFCHTLGPTPGPTPSGPSPGPTSGPTSPDVRRSEMTVCLEEGNADRKTRCGSRINLENYRALSSWKLQFWTADRGYPRRTNCRKAGSVLLGTKYGKCEEAFLYSSR